MKNSLSHLPQNKQAELELIKDIVLEIETELGIAKDENDQQACEEPKPEKAEAPPPVCVSVPDAAPYIAESRSSNRALKAFGLTTIGMGAASIVAGGVLQALSIVAKKKANEASSYDEFVDQIAKKKQFQTGAIAGFAAGAITAGIGIAELVVAVKRKKKGAALEAQNPMVEKCSSADTPKEAEPPAEQESDKETPVEDDNTNDKPEASVTVGVGSLNFTLRF